MANIMRLGGGSKKHYLFKNGVITDLDIGSWVLQNGELISPSNSTMTITLPNDGKNKVLIFDLYTIGQDGIMQITSDAGYQTVNITSTYNNPQLKYMASQKVKTTSKVTGNTYSTNRNTFHITAIWYEYLN